MRLKIYATWTLHRKETPVAGDIPKSEPMIIEHINRFVCMNMKGLEMKK